MSPANGPATPQEITFGGPLCTRRASTERVNANSGGGEVPVGTVTAALADPTSGLTQNKSPVILSYWYVFQPRKSGNECYTGQRNRNIWAAHKELLCFMSARAVIRHRLRWPSCQRLRNPSDVMCRVLRHVRRVFAQVGVCVQCLATAPRYSCSS